MRESDVSSVAGSVSQVEDIASEMTSSAGDPLAFVPPARRELIRTRIEIIDSYLALSPPTAADALASAESLGIALSTFYALARIWKSRRNPSDLIGAGAKTGARKPRVLGDEEFIEQGLRDLPVGKTAEEDVVALIKLAAQNEVKVRSVSALRRKVRELRPDDSRNPLEGDLIVGQVAVAIPVTYPGGAIHPVATLLVHHASGRVISARLATIVPGAAEVARSLVDSLRTKTLVDGDTVSSDAVVSILLGGHDSAEWARLSQTLEEHHLRVLGRDAKGRAESGAYCTRQLLKIGLKGHPMMAAWAPERRRAKDTTGLNTPVSIEEAQAVLDARLAASGPGAQVRLGSGTNAIDLALALLPIATQG